MRVETGQRLVHASRRRRVLPIAILCCLSFASLPAIIRAGATTLPTVRTTSASKTSKAYCGVRSLYAAAVAEGVQFPGGELIRPEYIGSREGSSIEELERAAREHGLHTFAFVNGTIGVLRQSTHPVILHVESNPGSGKYDHFVLYLGERGDQLLILDPASSFGEPARPMSAADVGLMWDGAGLVVSATPIKNRILAGSIGQIFLCGSIVGLLSMVALRGHPNRITSRLACVAPRGVMGEILAIVVVALLAPVCSAFYAGGGLLANAAQLQIVEQSHIASFLSRISFAAAEKKVAAGSAVYVDARYASDYGVGHIPSAINVPVTANASFIRLLLANVPTDKLVIIYCQSKSCPFSKIIASAVMQQGYEHVELLDGGWEEWSKWKR